jgi:hypothetical protein
MAEQAQQPRRRLREYPIERVAKGLGNRFVQVPLGYKVHTPAGWMLSLAVGRTRLAPFADLQHGYRCLHHRL